MGLEGLGKQQLKVIPPLGLDHLGIGNELVEFRHSPLIEVHQGIEPKQDPGQFKKDVVQAVVPPHMHQLMGQDPLLPCPIPLDLFPQKDVLEKREGQTAPCHGDLDKVGKAFHLPFALQTPYTGELDGKRKGGQ